MFRIHGQVEKRGVTFVRVDNQHWFMQVILKVGKNVLSLKDSAEDSLLKCSIVCLEYV